MNSCSKKLKIAFASLCLLIGCEAQESGKHSDNASFKIGIVTSTQLDWEKDVIIGANMYMQQYQERKNCSNKSIELIFDNSADTPENTVRAVNRLIKTHNIDAMIGPNISENAIPASEVSERNQLAMLSLLSTHPKVTEDKNFVFQMIASNRQQSSALANFILKQKKKVVIIYQKTDAYSRNFARALERLLNEHHYLKLKTIAYSRVENNLNDILSEIKKEDDLVVIPVETADAIKIAEAVIDQNSDVQIVGTDYWQILKVAQRPKLTGTLVIDHWHFTLNEYQNSVHGPKVNKKVEQSQLDIFNKGFDGRQSKMSISAVFVIEALQLIESYLCQTNKPSAKGLADFLRNIENYNGITGNIRSIKKNRVLRDMYLIKIDGDNTKIVEMLPVGEEDE